MEIQPPLQRPTPVFSASTVMRDQHESTSFDLLPPVIREKLANATHLHQSITFTLRPGGHTDFSHTLCRDGRPTPSAVLDSTGDGSLLLRGVRHDFRAIKSSTFSSSGDESFNHCSTSTGRVPLELHPAVAKLDENDDDASPRATVQRLSSRMHCVCTRAEKLLVRQVSAVHALPLELRAAHPAASVAQLRAAPVVGVVTTRFIGRPELTLNANVQDTELVALLVLRLVMVGERS